MGIERRKHLKWYDSLAVRYMAATYLTIGPAVVIGEVVALWRLSSILPKGTPSSVIWTLILWTMAAMTITAVSIGTPLWIVGFRQYVLRPIQDIGEVMQATAQGDLTRHSDFDRDDEIGILSDQMNLVIDSLNQIAHEARGSAQRVTTSATQLSSSAQEVNSSTMEISSSVQQIAQGAELQTRKVEETTATMQEITATLQQVTNEADSAAETSNEAADIAGQGEEATIMAMQKMAEVEQVISRSAVAVRLLGERSEEIGNIVDMITQIADQTNLLALNAAIEAARAGESGRGFSVVAEEVRKLAEGSGKAAEQIGTLIREVQGETGKAVTAMEEGTKEVTGCAEVVNRSGDALKQINMAVRETARMASSIAEVMSVQAKRIEEVDKAMGDIAAVVEENAASAQETAAAAEEQTACMEEITSSAQELAEMASRLDDSVQRFKTAG